VLPYRPEIGLAFLAIAAGAVARPLTPAYRAEELEFYLGDRDARALVVARGRDSPAVAVAWRLGVPILELDADFSGAGCLTLAGTPAGAPVTGTASGPGEGDDVALLLHTSGTTSRPKMVPPPPEVRMPRSVGPARGQQTAIMNDAGDMPATGTIGAMVIGGPHVTRGHQTPRAPPPKRLPTEGSVPATRACWTPRGTCA
jgi:non-ribosomal peptide synthetase component F